MAKEFKLFDAKYSKLRGTAISSIERVCGKIAAADINRITKWDPEAQNIYFRQDYSHAMIAEAVYHSVDAELWQQFRVSLKGLTTQERLYALQWRWKHCVAENDINVMRREAIRINNYIGSLVRGGYLAKQTLEIIK